MTRNEKRPAVGAATRRASAEAAIAAGRIMALTALNGLLDVCRDGDLEHCAVSAAAAVKGVMRVEEMRVRRMGPFRFGSISIELRKAVDAAGEHEVKREVVRAVWRRSTCKSTLHPGERCVQRWINSSGTSLRR